MVDIMNGAWVRRTPASDPVQSEMRTALNFQVPPLSSVTAGQWGALAERAIEPNAYYLAGWEMAVNASARGRTGALALAAHDGAASSGDGALIGLIPVISSWQAYGLPLPALVSADPYGTLCTPLLDRRCADDAAAALMHHAREAGAHALILRTVSLEGAAMAAFKAALARDGLEPHVLEAHERACLDATRDADTLLREALGVKKLKDLRRQRNRLAEHGDVTFNVARTPDDIAHAVETFLTLEASGWKARRGTALAQHDGDAAFVRQGTAALATRNLCEIITLRAGATPVAAGIVLRHLNRAFYFKIGIDEQFSRFSPGVQLTLDLTRHLCADPTITTVDSTASPGHPMIEPIWRGRLAIGDVLIPLRRGDPVVPLIRSTMTLRRLAREPMRRAVHLIRKHREKYA